MANNHRMEERDTRLDQLDDELLKCHLKGR